MYLTRLTLNDSRQASLWVANPYRVHQRLSIAAEGDTRLLFRIEDQAEGTRHRPTTILVQTHCDPDWSAAFAAFPVLSGPPEGKPFDPVLVPSTAYRFRLRANPTVFREGKRLGLLQEEDQRAWIERKLSAVQAELQAVSIEDRGLQRCRKGSGSIQTHQSLDYEGVLRCLDPEQLRAALEQGIGPAKGYGFGLLSLARSA
jgi:CRISPR system Cascade subunit CasE